MRDDPILRETFDLLEELRNGRRTVFVNKRQIEHNEKDIAELKLQIQGLIILQDYLIKVETRILETVKYCFKRFPFGPTASYYCVFERCCGPRWKHNNILMNNIFELELSLLRRVAEIKLAKINGTQLCCEEIKCRCE